jgi:hypothetical protein
VDDGRQRDGNVKYDRRGENEIMIMISLKLYFLR